MQPDLGDIFGVSLRVLLARSETTYAYVLP